MIISQENEKKFFPILIPEGYFVTHDMIINRIKTTKIFQPEDRNS